MKVSDELREWASHAMVNKHADVRELSAIADRIDAEMVELPKTADGVPIHIWDTAYTEDGDGFEIVRIIFELGTTKITCSTGGDVGVTRIPSYVFHKRPDSWERIADELEAWCDRTDVDGDACGKPRDLAKRIRKLAEREG